MYLICLDLPPPRSGERRKAITTMAMSAQTIGRDQLWGPLGIAGGRPRPCEGWLGWRLTPAMLRGPASYEWACPGIRVPDGTDGYVAPSWSAPAPACGPAAAALRKPR